MWRACRLHTSTVRPAESHVPRVAKERDGRKPRGMSLDDGRRAVLAAIVNHENLVDDAERGQGLGDVRQGSDDVRRLAVRRDDDGKGLRRSCAALGQRDRVNAHL